MQVEIVTAIVSAVSAIAVAFIGFITVKTQRRAEAHEKENNIRASQRAEEARLQLQMINANCKLTVGVAAALKAGHCNGEVEEGLRAVNEANDKYQQFLADVAMGVIK